MNGMSNELLLNTYQTALRLELDREFIQLLEFELQKRKMSPRLETKNPASLS